jgi:hypothetical protein
MYSNFKSTGDGFAPAPPKMGRNVKPGCFLGVSDPEK